MEILATGTHQLEAAALAEASVRDVRQAADTRELVQAVRKLNQAEYVGNDSELTIVMDRASRRPLVRIVNRETKEVIQQIPPEYVLRMREELEHGY